MLVLVMIAVAIPSLYFTKVVLLLCNANVKGLVMKSIDEMGDDELLGKIDSILKIGYAFVPLILKRVGIIKSAKLVRLGWSIKNDLSDLKSNSNEKKISAGVRVADKILDFRRNNKESFDEIFDVLEDIVFKYKENPKELNEAIAKILD